jgi:hypothetical protein
LALPDLRRIAGFVEVVPFEMIRAEKGPVGRILSGIARPGSDLVTPAPPQLLGAAACRI